MHTRRWNQANGMQDPTAWPSSRLAAEFATEWIAACEDGVGGAEDSTPEADSHRHLSSNIMKAKALKLVCSGSMVCRLALHGIESMHGHSGHDASVAQASGPHRLWPMGRHSTCCLAFVRQLMIARLGLPLVIARATALDYQGYCLGDDQNIVPATHRKGFLWLP